MKHGYGNFEAVPISDTVACVLRIKHRYEYCCIYIPDVPDIFQQKKKLHVSFWEKNL